MALNCRVGRSWPITEAGQRTKELRLLQTKDLFKEIMTVCCETFKVDVSIVLSQCRLERVFAARMTCCYLMRRLGVSYPVIGLHLGRDHSTIHSAVKRALMLNAMMPQRKRLVDGLEQRVREKLPNLNGWV